MKPPSWLVQESKFTFTVRFDTWRQTIAFALGMSVHVRPWWMRPVFVVVVLWWRLTRRLP